jgi:hypothetical protein
LAFGAEVTAPSSNREALNSFAAFGTIFTTSMSNLELKVGSTYLSTGAKVGIHAGSLVIDGCAQNLLDSMVKSLYLRLRQAFP